jgi:hypothetical protein
MCLWLQAVKANGCKPNAMQIRRSCTFSVKFLGMFTLNQHIIAMYGRADFTRVAYLRRSSRWWVSLKGTGFSPYIKGIEINGALVSA